MSFDDERDLDGCGLEGDALFDASFEDVTPALVREDDLLNQPGDLTGEAEVPKTPRYDDRDGELADCRASRARLGDGTGLPIGCENGQLWLVESVENACLRPEK